MAKSSNINSYEARGVSAKKDEVVTAVENLDKGLFPSAFCHVSSDIFSNDETRCAVMHTDDVGTKAALAYLAWREGSPLSIWRGIAQDSLAMNLDDCACVGACGPFYVTNTIARNAKLIPGEVLKAIIDGYSEISEILAKEGIRIKLVGGETSDCGDVIRTIFVESNVVTTLERKSVIDTNRIKSGDLIVSFASTGRARWEFQNNSGIGSNGLTNARHELLHQKYTLRYPETFAPEVERQLIYRGNFDLNDPLPNDDHFSIGSALLSPTRIYLPFIKELLEEINRDDIHALIHCTGGGQTKIANFGGKNGKNKRYVKDQLLSIPPIFQTIAKKTDHNFQEMYRVFNMGQLLEAVITEKIADKCVRIAEECGIYAKISGHVEESRSNHNEVVIIDEGISYSY
jgi:phosphoribosylformylglycinamidine cyclo-ligase